MNLQVTFGLYHSAIEARKLLNDLELAAALANRDEQAARVLFDLHFDATYRFLRQLTGRKEDAEDLSQQTFMRVLQNARKYDGRAGLRSWIFGIAFREFGKLRRRRAWWPLSREIPSDLDLAEYSSNGALLETVLAKLSPVHRSAFLLFHVEGLTIEEIALVQEVPAGTVKSRLHFARLRLKELLKQEEFYVSK